ncbi:hypothetical protein FH729_05615 [Bacteroides thetaiotaomicron]|uniref:NUMOD3 domain-containing DNA-binding protein n=1 Tax=Bacteroides thetaiotaomicron TaxID=818 RepID=UPI0019280E63|nr:NUMOD3 domain-containing DNA-binding protein [Bacteroides thetaiotaomicron]MBL3917642.1 hypothetical protein [Bacteroides thetaiotaomicron]MBL3941849.1 hypothetical protein [Bacteroides thetaiotaomicron]MBL3946638.1 hypothetical protein [Bacteroides thetaiotaomicron]MBL3956906.1 hypothetical protein [Bacteroides thetaiotaomicron]
MENINNTNHPSREGNMNPMYGKRHSELTKRKISDSQKQRYAAIRKSLQAEDINLKSKVGKSDLNAKIDLLKQCIFSDTIGFSDIQQALNFVAIMSSGINSNYLKKVINDELNQYLNNLNRHVQ